MEYTRQMTQKLPLKISRQLSIKSGVLQLPEMRCINANLLKASMSLARKPFDCFDFDYKDSVIKTQNFLDGER